MIDIRVGSVFAFYFSLILQFNKEKKILAAKFCQTINVNLVVDGDDDLALVGGLVRSLDVFDLKGVGRTGSVVSHTGNKNEEFIFR